LEFSKSLDKATKKFSNIWVGGDLNLKDMDWQKASPSQSCSNKSFYRQVIEKFNDANLTQMVNQPTREKNTLDLFFTANPSLVQRVKILPGISDHNIPEVCINASAKVTFQKPRKIPLYKKADWPEIKKSLSDYHKVMKESNKYSALSTEDLWSDFQEHLNGLINKHVPTKQSSHRDHLPWVNQHIKRLIRRRNRAFKRQRKTNQPSDRQKFLNLKHLVRMKIKEAYTQYLENMLEINTDASSKPKPNLKQMYTMIKHAKQESFAIPPMKFENELHVDDIAKANALNKQFQSVFSNKSPLSLASICKMKLAEQYQPAEQHQHPQSEDTENAHIPSMPDIDISEKGIEKLLKNLNPGKACGPDCIKPIVLKTLAEELAPILMVIFQKSLKEGSFPSIWKQAHVAPVFKKGDKSLPVNYRPISLTCVLCKVMEHIIASSIVKHFTDQNILYHLQHGFREKRSCVTQLTMLVNDLTTTMDEGKQTDLILLDFSKAFDKVNHEKALLKLHQYGVRGQTLKWVKSFLDNRLQSVVLNGVKSDTIPVSSGVPQGSVLGPLIFLAYINDLPHKIKSKVRLFADDTALYLVLALERDSVTLQEDLRLLEKWELEWDMQFNPSKCQVIHVTRMKNPFPTKYYLHGVELESVTSARYLGVDISEDLSWEGHIDRITKKGNQCLGFLRRNLKVKSKPIKSLAYQTLVRPQLEYASEVWCPFQQNHIDQLEMVQRRAARWIMADYGRYSSVDAMLSSLNLRRLDQRRIDSRLSLMYKIHHGLVAIPKDEYLTPHPRIPRNGHPHMYRLIGTRKDYYKYSYFPRTIFHWNKLPANVAELPTVDRFNAALPRITHSSP
jgi:hypothetical protein